MKNNLLVSIGLAALRVGASAMMLTHGFPKFQKLISGDFEFANPIGIGESPSLFLTVIGEFIAPMMIIVGYKTRIAAVPTVLTMLVAAFIVHRADAFGQKELALLYALVFTVVLLLGPGKYSLDKR